MKDTLIRWGWTILLFVTFVAVVVTITMFSINKNLSAEVQALQQEKLNFEKDVAFYEEKLNSIPDAEFLNMLSGSFTRDLGANLDEFTREIYEYVVSELARWLKENNIKTYYETNKESYDANTG